MGETRRHVYGGNAMAYEYRNVKCPWCDHVFMWNKNCHEGLVLHEYKLKSTGERVEKAKCPKCEMEMVVLEHVLTGIDVDDDRIQTTGIRRI